MDEMNESQPSQLELLADAPITQPSQDELERDTYAKRLATIIDSFKGADSYVMALHGGWGTGNVMPQTELDKSS